jgi:hypothetical protein
LKYLSTSAHPPPRISGKLDRRWIRDEEASMKEEASVETIVTVEDLVAHSKAGRDLTAPETLL